MKQPIRYGIIGTITMLLLFGGIIVLSPDELDNAYYCDRNDRVGIFEYLSSTNKTGYWHDDEGKRKQSTCTKSKWIPLKDYCEQQGITNCGSIGTPSLEDEWTGRYWCTDTCDEIYR